MFRIVLALFIFALGLGKSVAAEMRAVKAEDENVFAVVIEGEIAKGDDEKFRSLVTPLLKKGYLLHAVDVFSPGGDLESAMGIGDQIYMLHAETIAPTEFLNEPGFAACWVIRGMFSHTLDRDASIKRDLKSGGGTSWCDCSGACFLIWASGMSRDGNYLRVNRFAVNGLGTLPPKEAKSAFDKEKERIREYLKKREVDESVVDSLFWAPPEAPHRLTQYEVDRAEGTPFLHDLVQATCGTSKARIVEDDKAHTTTYIEDAAHEDCTRAVFKKFESDGAKEYLAAVSMRRR